MISINRIYNKIFKQRCELHKNEIRNRKTPFQLSIIFCSLTLIFRSRSAYLARCRLRCLLRDKVDRFQRKWFLDGKISKLEDHSFRTVQRIFTVFGNTFNTFSLITSFFLKGWSFLFLSSKRLIESRGKKTFSLYLCWLTIDAVTDWLFVV
jgi:hypothetical protein